MSLFSDLHCLELWCSSNDHPFVHHLFLFWCFSNVPFCLTMVCAFLLWSSSSFFFLMLSYCYYLHIRKVHLITLIFHLIFSIMSSGTLMRYISFHFVFHVYKHFCSCYIFWFYILGSVLKTNFFRFTIFLAVSNLLIRHDTLSLNIYCDCFCKL